MIAVSLTCVAFGFSLSYNPDIPVVIRERMKMLVSFALVATFLYLISCLASFFFFDICRQILTETQKPHSFGILVLIVPRLH